eukprot:TRINITY_DN25022_c0_g2_i1.p1 TRINITY_DN25022_c0_g2~~TRINITY_DN25022_c0_g2_i1.p1  ORF type:complete len:422 (-),score=91.23 TRINITY_DN25022_c0_g2_i1:72-1337(-)
MLVTPLRRTAQPGTIAELSEQLAAQSEEAGRLRERLWAEERGKASLQAELTELRSENQQLTNDLQTAIESLRLGISVATKEQRERFESVAHLTVSGEQRRRMTHLAARFGLPHHRVGLHTGNLASSTPEADVSAPEVPSLAIGEGGTTVELPEADDQDANRKNLLWEVVGGKRDGVLVRTGQDFNSAEARPSRLNFGALVKEIKLLGIRLHFELVSGHGPQKGWVSIRHSGKRLLVRKASDDVSTRHESNLHNAPESLLQSSTCAANASDAAEVADEADTTEFPSSASPLGTPESRPTTDMLETSPVETEHFVMSPEKKRKIGEASAASSPPSSSCSSDLDPSEPELEESCCAPSLRGNSEDQLELFSRQHLRLSPPVNLLYESGPQAEVKVLRRIVRDLKQHLTQAQAQLSLVEAERLAL